MKTIGVGDIHKGHRARMRQKFSEHGSEIFDTYELLEMLLYSVIPAKDTNPLAKRLLAAFGSLDAVLSAGREELMGVEGIGEKAADMLVSVGEIAKMYTLDVQLPDLVFDDYKKVGEYFVEYFEGAKENRIAAMMLDNAMNLIKIDTVSRGVDFQNADVGEGRFVELALSCGAAVLIIAHNHPFGPMYPTDGDTSLNESVMLSLSNVGVLLADHYIVCGDRYVGFMASFGKRFAQHPELSKFYKTKDESGEAMAYVP